MDSLARSPLASDPPGANRLGGEAVAAVAGGTYELRTPGVRGEGTGESLGRWPRSTERDVARALDLARGPGRAWSELRPHERGERLRAAARRLGASPDPRGRVAATLGLSASELAPHGLGLEGKLSAAVREGLARDGRPGISLVRPHWSQLWEGVGRLVARELAAGRRVVLLPEGRVPACADRLADVLEAAELPPGAFALLHDDSEQALRAALDQAGEADLVVAAAAEDEPAWRARLAGEVGGHELPFGAGVHEARRPRLELEPLGVTTARVGLDDDPVRQARRVALAALGRGATLSGQAPGHVRRVLCEPRRFSAFTAALLELLEGDPDLVPPLEPGPRLAAELARVREEGLAEGATLIHEGAPGESRRPSRRAMMGPLVFTNVEAHMRLAAWSRPAPVLLLMRSSAEPSRVPGTR